LTLRKFEKYVVSYVIGGSFIRGDVTKESDVDTFVIINDTDVRKMPRVELRERLRSQINQFISEAEAMAGVAPYKLNVQIYLLTEFWDAVKDANPVMFTFIRDGVPIYDQGTFMPWKSLLRMEN
jgi:predicted nucleotidyltransferase